LRSDIKFTVVTTQLIDVKSLIWQQMMENTIFNQNLIWSIG